MRPSTLEARFGEGGAVLPPLARGPRSAADWDLLASEFLKANK